MPARALLRMVEVEQATPPYNHVELKIFYPALDPSTEAHYRTGILPFDTQWSPAPVVIFFTGVNCSAYSYEWLATALADCGIVTVLSSWVAENLPGRISISPGIDLEAVHRDRYGVRSTSSSLPDIVKVLNQLRTESHFSGHLRESFILGGHSAGGTIALQNARYDWYPDVIGAFAYCANPLATTILGGWGKGEYPPLPTDVPVLIMGATHDGIGDHHVKAFGNTDETGAEFISRIFAEGNFNDSALCIFEGANHHSICHPIDHSIGRYFMDTPPCGDETLIRQELVTIITDFVHGIASEKTMLRPSTAAIWQQTSCEGS